jgi:uncharacterized membrane protein YhaH (DUF805 family)
VSFVQAIRTCFAKYVTFSGRATRPEYWFFFLFVFLGGVVATALDTSLFPAHTDVQLEATETTVAFEAEDTTGPVAAAFSLVTFVPLMAAGWRRMHDSGRSGLHLVYPLIVMIGTATFAAFGIGLAEGMGTAGSAIGIVTAVIMFVALAVLIISPLLVLWWLCRPTQPGTNQYGPDPRGAPA